MATPQTSPAPLFADSPTERMPGGWQFAAGRETPAAARQGARRAGLLLLLLTVIGGLLRFYQLNQPFIGPGEIFTLGQVYDSYAQLALALKASWSMPLHYEALWLQGQFTHLTPFGLRVMSAVAGTLMIPAIYFLTRQFASRSTALVAALFTCFSAFMVTYSRDADLYMPFWLLCTLNVLLLVRWLRTGGLIAWTLWLLTGVAMAGYHALGLALLAVELPILLTAQRAHWAKAVFFIIGAAIIASGPIVYYLKFNPEAANIAAEPWNAAGIDWVDGHSDHWGGAVHVADTLATHLFSWNWMQQRNDGAIEPWLWNGAIAALGMVLGFAALGALPWRNRWRDRAADGDLLEAPWRVYAWLAAWIVLPMYAAYCLSIADRIDPLAWFIGQQGWFQQAHLGVPTFAWLIGGWIISALLLSISPWVARGVTALLVVGMLLIFTGLFLRSGFAVIPAAEQWSALLRHPIAILILAILIPALLWAFSGERIAIRCRRTGTFVAVSAALFVLCVLIARAIPEPLPGSVWTPRYLGFIWPAIAIATVLLLCRLPVWPLRWLAIIFLLSINIAQIGAQLWVQSERSLDPAAGGDISSLAVPADTVTEIEPHR